MDSMKLKDFKADDSEFDPEEDPLENAENSLDGNTYREEINTIRIDKLSNKVTIISVIIPVMIGVILVFAYLDMKERVVDVDLTKQSQVERISQLLEEKLNALDVKIAKNSFDIETELPKLTDKNIEIEGRLVKLNASKADTKKVDSSLSDLSKKVGNNTKKSQSNSQTIEKIKKETLANFKATQAQFDKTANKIKEEITLFKEEFDARLLELSEYEQQIALLKKDLSLLDKKTTKLEQTTLTQNKLDEISEQLQNEMIKLKTYHDEHVKELKIQQEALRNKLSKLEADFTSQKLKPASQGGQSKPTESSKSQKQGASPTSSDAILQKPLTQ